MGAHTLERRARHRRSGTFWARGTVAVVVIVAVAGGFWYSNTQRRATALPSQAVATTTTATAATAVPGPTDPLRMRIYSEAIEHAEAGIPYLQGGRTTAGLDCAGLVWVALKGSGLKVPYRSVAGLRSWTTPIEHPEPGDLVFYSRHVAVYVGDGMVVDATDTMDTVGRHVMWPDPTPTFGRVPA